MPKFILDQGSPEAARAFNDLDAFTRGYIEAMFFTNTGSGDDGELEHATVADLSTEASFNIIADCAAFQSANRATLERAYAEHAYSEEQAGRDFWFTRNGHGVGFWDRGIGEVGDLLSAACGWPTQFGNVDLYTGDDGQVYFG